MPLLSSRSNNGVIILIAFSSVLLCYKSIAYILADKFELIPRTVSERNVNNIFIFIGLLIYGIGVYVYFYVGQNPNWITVFVILFLVALTRLVRDYIEPVPFRVIFTFPRSGGSSPSRFETRAIFLARF